MASQGRGLDLFDVPGDRSNLYFLKANVYGNDFVVVHDSTFFNCKNEAVEEMVLKICDRRFGVGCDQLLIVRESEDHDIGVSIYNADGTTAAMCGNGMLCLGGLFFSRVPTANVCSIGIFCGSVCRRSVICKKMDNDLIHVSLGQFQINDVGDLKVFVDVGNFHEINIVKNEFSCASEFFVQFENESLCSKKNINVSRVGIIKKNEHIAVLTFEAGVGETLCCGSGVCASAISVLQNSAMGVVHRVYFETKGTLRCPTRPFVDVVFDTRKNGNVALVGGFELCYTGFISV